MQCGWCSEKATHRVVLGKGSTGQLKSGARRHKREQTAPICPTHRDQFSRRGQTVKLGAENP